MREARRLLSAGLIALALHLTLLSWPLNQGKEKVPVYLTAKRISISLGEKKINKPEKLNKRQNPPSVIPSAPPPITKAIITEKVSPPLETRKKEPKKKSHQTNLPQKVN